MWRVDYIHGKGEPASLELLGSRAVLGIAESLAGPDFVPTYESMVMKSAGDGAPVPWHQDAVHARRHRLFNVDIYLDDSRRGAGALHVIPGSQVRRTDACALAETHGWELPGAIEVELEAGDVLVHDDMIVHGSPPAAGNALRRTIYFEFRAAQSILEDGPWTPEWMDARLRLVPLALAERARWVGPDEQFEWRVAPDLRPDGLRRRRGRAAGRAHRPHARGVVQRRLTLGPAGPTRDRALRFTGTVRTVVSTSSPHRSNSRRSSSPATRGAHGPRAARCGKPARTCGRKTEASRDSSTMWTHGGCSTIESIARRRDGGLSALHEEIT